MPIMTDHPATVNRVLQIVEPGIDGVFRHVEGLVDYLHERNIPVDLAFSSRRGSDRLLALVERVRERGGEALDLRVGNTPEPTDVPAILTLVRMTRRRKPAVIHAHSSKAGALMRMLPRLLLAQRTFYTPHAYFGMRNTAGIKAQVFNQVERLLWRKALTINVSQEEADFATGTLGVSERRLRVIPNGVDTRRFRSFTAAEKVAWRLERKMPEDAVVLGTVGRFSFQKNPETLVRAVLNVLPRHPRLHFFAVGTGELVEVCEQMVRTSSVADRFHRIDYLSDTAPFYGAIDGFALASRYEGLSIAVLEALSAGLPIILTDVPGNRTFLHKGLTHAWGAAACDVAGLEAAIEGWLADHAANRASNHRAIADHDFSLDSSYGHILQEYGITA
ncbi:glycosyltransferase [Terrimicrobium sacchariphilum]|uniref:Glycosyltransferase n=2 Tax=Terrimicrobium sacchariphilum TaxID=690879 RepID=A0A146GCK9_TERSA|nr:glycosyltransferase [Terrimicrobium sacchariphilum]